MSHDAIASDVDSHTCAKDRGHCGINIHDPSHLGGHGGVLSHAITRLKQQQRTNRSQTRKIIL